jgi:YacP-like NYN domain
MLLIDTFNVLHAAPSAHPGLAGLSIEGLAGLISQSRYAGHACLLIIDGTGGGIASTGALNLPSGFPASGSGPHAFVGVRCMFAGPGKDADALIEHLLDDLEHRQVAHRALVVSSDRRVIAAAVGVRAGSLTSIDFLRELISDAERQAAKRAARTGNKPTFAAGDVGPGGGLNQDETAAWLKAFGYAAPAEWNPSQPPILPIVEDSEPRPTPRLSPRTGDSSKKPANPQKPQAIPPGPLLDDQAVKDLEAWAANLNLDDLPPPKP